MLLPGLCLPAGGSQVFKHLTVHELVPDMAVETLGVSILPGTARFDIQRSYADLFQPTANCLGQELTAVVAAKVLRHAVSWEQLRQLVDHILAGDVSVHLQGQALPGILVYNREPLERGPSFCPIKNKIAAPHVVFPFCSMAMAGIRPRTQRTFFPLFPGDFEPFSTPQTINAFGIHLPAGRLQHPADTSIPETGMLAHQFQNLLQQSGFIVSRNRLVALAGTRLTQNPAGFAFGNVERLLQMLDGLAFARRAYQFPSAISLSIALSSSASASSFLSRVFSCSSSLRRLAWSIRRPPYSRRHL